MYYLVEVKERGPFTREEVLERTLSADTLVWREGMAFWSKISEFEELREAVAAAPPPLLVGIRNETEVQIHPDRIGPVVNRNKEVRYFIAVDGRTQGPYTLESLLREDLSDETLVWKEGLASWSMISELDELEEVTVRNRSRNGHKQGSNAVFYFVQKGDEKRGPYLLEELPVKEILTEDMLVWKAGQSEWMKITEVDELRDKIVRSHKVIHNKHTTNMYFLKKEGKLEGPYTLAALLNENITDDTLVWKEGAAGWIKATEIEELGQSAAWIFKPVHRAPEARHHMAHKYYVHHEGREQGPFAIEELIVLQINGDTMVRKDGVATWKRAADHEEIRLIVENINVKSAGQEEAKAHHNLALPKEEKQPEHRPDGNHQEKAKEAHIK